LGFMTVWYVSGKKDEAPPVKPVATVVEAKTGPAVTSPQESNLNPNEWSVLQQEMKDYVEELGLKSEVQVESGESEVLVSLKDTVPFESGKADLRPRALPVLEKVATMVLRRPTLRLEVRGHTDDRPISTATFPSNWELSAARASRVARYLI